MVDYDPKEIATQFITLQKEALLIPPDDQHLGMERWRDRCDRRRDSPGCCEFVEKVRGLLEYTMTSPYFREYLLHQLGLEYETGWMGEEHIIRINQRDYGIDLERGRYAFFDPNPRIAWEGERHYFLLAFPWLEYQEECGINPRVDWRLWMADLMKREDWQN